MKSAYSTGFDVAFQWWGTLSARLTASLDGRRFEGDPAGANPSVGGHEHRRVPPLGESLRPRSEGSYGVSNSPA